MVMPVFLLLILLLYVSGYYVSTYALAIFVDPEEVEEEASDATYVHRFLRNLTEDPRAFRQLAMLYKSFVLVAVTLLSARVVSDLLTGSKFNIWTIIIVNLLLIWPLYILALEYLPRRHSRSIIRTNVPVTIWIVVVIHAMFKPLVSIFRAGLSRHKADSELADGEREELVERAIEALADEAGIGQQFLAADEKHMISQIFMLDETMAREIMVPRLDIAAIEKSTSFRDIQTMVQKEGYSRYPVYDGTIDKVIGLLYAKDLLGKIPGMGEQFTIEKYVRPAFFVPETKIIRELLRDFKTRRQHIAIVVDEFGGVAGLVTLEDILEEIVGEIQDEHDTEEAEFQKLPDGRYRVSASMLIERLEELLDVEYDRGDYDTVGGLIYDLVGSVPNQGQQVQWHDLAFVVERVDGQRIKSLSVLKQD